MSRRYICAQVRRRAVCETVSRMQQGPRPTADCRSLVILQSAVSNDDRYKMRASRFEMDPKTTGLMDIPDEILQVCFARLSLEDIPRVKVVCKRWHKLGDAQLLRRLRRTHGFKQTYTFILDSKYVGGQYQGLQGVAIDSKTCKGHHIATLHSPQRLQFGAAGIDGQIYVLGGRSPLICQNSPKAWTVYPRVDVYEPLSNSWVQRQPMHAARYGFATGVISDMSTGNLKIIVAGGYNAEGEALSSAEVHDYEKNKWEAIISMRTISGPCKGQMFQGKFLVQQANGGLDSVEIYDSTSCLWSAFNPELSSEFCLKPCPEVNATIKSVTIDL